MTGALTPAPAQAERDALQAWLRAYSEAIRAMEDCLVLPDAILLDRGAGAILPRLLAKVIQRADHAGRDRAAALYTDAAALIEIRDASRRHRLPASTPQQEES